MNPVRLALNALNERLALADALAQSFEQAAGESEAPAWVFVFREQVEGIAAAAERLEMHLHDREVLQ